MEGKTLTPRICGDISRLRKGGRSHYNQSQVEQLKMPSPSLGIPLRVGSGCEASPPPQQFVAHSLLARFMNWNMLYGAMRSLEARAVDHISPLRDIVVTTPPSPSGAPFPMAAAVREKTAIDRARLFIQGRHMDGLKSMEIPQRV